MPKKRTTKDEYEYDQHLRDQEDIKRQVICEYRDLCNVQTDGEIALLRATIAQGELIIAQERSLLVYRQQMLDDRLKFRDSRNGGHHRSPSGKFIWDDGWREAKDGE